MSSGSTRPARGWPTSPSTDSSPCSTGARNRPGMAVSDGETVMVVKDMGLVATVFDERTLSGSQGPSGHRPHPLLDPRRLGLGRGTAGLPPGRTGRLRARPQRQPDQHRRAGREGRHAARLLLHGQRRRGRAVGPLLPRDRGPGPGAPSGAADRRGRLLHGADELAAPLRPARPARVPPAVPGPPRPARRARRLGPGLGDAGAQHHRGDLRARGRTRRARRDRRRRSPQPRDPVAAPGRAPALHLRVRLHRATRQPALRARGARGALPHGRAAGRSRRRPRPTW